MPGARARRDSERGKGSTPGLFRGTGLTHLELWRWFMKHLPNPGIKSEYVGVGRMINKPHLQGLIYPGKSSGCTGVD